MGIRGWRRGAGTALVLLLAILVVRAVHDGGDRADEGPVAAPWPLFPEKDGEAGAPTLPGAGSPGVLLAGVVVDAEGRAVPGAEVVAAGEGARAPERGTTGSDGRFRLPARPPAATFLLGARAPGYAPALRGGVRPADGEVRLVLHRPARLEGVVREDTGAPCPGARVRATLRFPGIEKDLVGFEAVADEEGRFAFEGLPPAEGSLRATYRGDSTGPRPFAIPPGLPRWEVDLVLATGPTIEGTVRSPDGALLAGIMVFASPTERSPDRGSQNATSDSEGRFVVRGVDSSTWELHGFDAEGRWLSTPPAPTTPPSRNVVVTMRPDPDPAAHFVFRLEGAGRDPPRIVQTTRWRPGEARSCASGSLFRKPDGSYGPDRVQGGTYRLQVSTPEGIGVVEEFRVEPGTTVDLGTIRLHPAAGAKGRFLDARGLPAPKARVFAGARRLHEEGAVKTDGTFEVRGLPAGSGRIRALLAGHDPLEADCPAGAGETADLGDLRFREATGAVRGAVRSRSGRPVGSVRLLVSPDDDLGRDADVRRIVAGSDGRFEAANLAPGSWAVSVLPPEEEGAGTGGAAFLRGGASFEIRDGERKEVVLEVD